jgi:hypothetical protein
VYVSSAVGKVYKYTENSSTWNRKSAATLSDTARSPGDAFGSSVSDYANGIFVGAPASYGGAGAVYIYN